MRIEIGNVAVQFVVDVYIVVINGLEVVCSHSVGGLAEGLCCEGSQAVKLLQKGFRLRKRIVVIKLPSWAEHLIEGEL
jgi:hypothetical protein